MEHLKIEHINAPDLNTKYHARSAGTQAQSMTTFLISDFMRRTSRQRAECVQAVNLLFKTNHRAFLVGGMLHAVALRDFGFFGPISSQTQHNPRSLTWAKWWHSWQSR